MSHDQLIAVVTGDRATYDAYRAAIAPLMADVGANFRHDVEVARVLSSEAQHAFDRLFVISFPDRDTATAFFADPAYLEIRNAHFPKAVTALETLAAFDTEEPS